jgi:hypothetical protein
MQRAFSIASSSQQDTKLKQLSLAQHALAEFVTLGNDATAALGDPSLKTTCLSLLSNSLRRFKQQEWWVRAKVQTTMVEAAFADWQTSGCSFMSLLETRLRTTASVQLADALEDVALQQPALLTVLAELVAAHTASPQRHRQPLAVPKLQQVKTRLDRALQATLLPSASNMDLQRRHAGRCIMPLFGEMYRVVVLAQGTFEPSVGRAYGLWLQGWLTRLRGCDFFLDWDTTSLDESRIC